MGKGIGLSTLVFIVFLILKLAEIGVVATWSWVWVLSPLWIPFVLVIGIWLLMLFDRWIYCNCIFNIQK